MSFTDRLVLWLHIGFAIFALGPVTVAVLSTPRYIRGGNPVIVGYLLRTTRVYTLVSLGVLVFGLVSAQQHKEFSKPWLTISMTLFVVALVLLVIIMRDQRRAVHALQLAEAQATPVATPGTAVRPAEGPSDAAEEAADNAEAARSVPGTGAKPTGTPAAGHDAHHVASVERGRIATMGGVVALIYLVILILMVWR
jgi:hypothetical protein